jgi:DNA polymerase-1
MQLDYSQAELRVMAAQAGETNMIHWFKIGRDIHLAVACDVNQWDYNWAKDIMDNNHDNKDYIEIKVQRKKAKTINFGIIYGQTAKKLAIGLGGTIREAELYLKDYNERFPKIAKFIKKQHKFVKNHGFVRNLFGRKRRLPNIDHPDWGKSAEAQRQSVNAPIQGAASDYTLFSSILIWEKIRKGELPTSIIQAYTVHDSLGYFIYPKDLHTVIPIMDEICKNPETKEWFGFQIDDVTMAVDFEISAENWGKLDDYNAKTNYCELVA